VLQPNPERKRRGLFGLDVALFALRLSDLFPTEALLTSRVASAPGSVAALLVAALFKLPLKILNCSRVGKDRPGKEVCSEPEVPSLSAPVTQAKARS